MAFLNKLRPVSCPTPVFWLVVALVLATLVLGRPDDAFAIGFPAPSGAPDFNTGALRPPSSVEVGESFRLEFEIFPVHSAEHGGTSVSFPGFTSRDANGSSSRYSSSQGRVRTIAYPTGLSNVTYYDRGDPLWTTQDSREPAEYLLVESDDSSWSRNSSRELVLEVTPLEPGEFQIYYRFWLCADGYTDCTRVPYPNNIQGYDQQGWGVAVFTVRVEEPDPASVIDSMGCSPTRVLEGETVSCRPRLSGGAPTEYDWDAIGGSPSSGTTRNFSTRWNTPGTKRIDFEVCNDSGCDSRSQSVEVTPRPRNCFRNLGTLPTGTTSIDGTWNGDCASTHQSGSYARFYAFTLTRRTQVQIDLRSAADAYLYLLRGAGSGGSIVDEDDDGGSTGNNSLLDLTLEAGTYTVEATTLRSGATANFSLYIDATAASINCFRNLGTLPTGTTSIDGTWNGDCASTHQSGSYARFYAFTLTRRTQVQIDLRSAADAYLYLLRGAGSGGSIVDEDDDGGSTGNNSYLDLTLEAGGYTIEATTYGSGVTGDFALYIDATAASINCFRNLGTLPTGTTSIDGTWNGDCASTHQSGSYARFYAFTLTRRTQVQIDLRSAADAYLYLLRGAGSGGSIVDEDDDGGSTGNNSLLDLTLEAGTYTVEATTLRSGATANFSLYIDATAASINCFRNLGTLPTGTTSIDGTWNGDCASTHQSGSYARFYAFTLTRRTQVQIDLRSAADAYLYLLRGAGSGGSIVDEDDDGGSTGNNSYLDLTLEAGGYTIEATTYGSGVTGDFALEIHATPAPAPTADCVLDMGTLPTGSAIIDGTWDSACGSTHRSGSYARYFSFTLTKITRVWIELHSEEDTYMYLLSGAGSAGTVLEQDDNDASGTNSQIRRTLSEGTYTVEATTHDSDVTGNFTFAIYFAGAQPPPPVPCIQPLPRFSPLPGVSPIEGEWASDCLSEHRSGRYARYYTFILPATAPSSSTELIVTLESFDADAYSYLLEGEGTDGRVIAMNDNGPLRDTQSQIRRFLDGGAYTVEATTKEPSVSGQFSLTVSYTTVSVPSPRIDSMGCAPLEVLVGETVNCRPTLSGGEPTRYLWGAIGGNPWSSTGENFSTQWDSPGEKQIVFEVCNDAGCDTGEQSITVDAPPPPLPSVPLGDPTGLQASAAGSGQVRLNWQPGANAEVHWLWSVKVDGSGGKYTRASGTASTTTVVGLENGQNYWLIIIAGRNVNGVQEWSQWSQWVNFLVSGAAVQVANDDRAALLTLYYATGGPNWANNQNWASDEPLDQWYGVTTDADGRVIGLDLGSNQLSGPIPPELGSLSNLTWLDLGSNQLSGPIPPELGSLSNLTWLDFGSNQLSGPIPPGLGSLSNLDNLFLDSNQLSGPIPPGLGSLSNLTWLFLDSNQLSGPIPPELGSLSNLDKLSLDSNQLSGPIPPELGSLSTLNLLFLAGNQLTGCVPAGLQGVQYNDFDALGLPFCGTAGGGAPPASQQAPDLGVTLTISGGGLLYSGATATVTATVFNEGDGVAPGYTLLYYRSQDRRFTNDNVTNSVSAGALPPSTNRIWDLGFTVPADAGDYYFAACVGGVPGESDTTNNCSDWTSASILHPVTLTTSDCSTGHILGAVPDSTEISGTVLARRPVSQANVIWRVIDAFGNTDSSGTEQLGSMSEGETKDFAISTAWGGLNNTCDLSLRWVY